jgi:hypothetical protein
MKASFGQVSKLPFCPDGLCGYEKWNNDGEVKMPNVILFNSIAYGSFGMPEIARSTLGILLISIG